MKRFLTGLLFAATSALAQVLRLARAAGPVVRRVVDILAAIGILAVLGAAMAGVLLHVKDHTLIYTVRCPK